MGNWNQTSNVAVVVNIEKVSRKEVRDLEAHSRQYKLVRNAREDYKKYNYSFGTDYDSKRYADAVWKKLKTGIKYDKSQLKEDEFWAGRVYKKDSGKTTTYVESMIFCPPFKVHPDDIETFLQSSENQYFEDIVNFLKMNERFKDCEWLGFNVHMDEVYIPESVLLDDGTEYILPEEERWKHAYVKPHLHVDMIPLVKEVDKNGVEYKKLSRKEVWKSRNNGRYMDSYREFNDEKYDAVDREYGFDRGNITAEQPKEERSIRMSLKEWQEKNDQERFERLVKQQQEENERMVNSLKEEIDRISELQEVVADELQNIEKDANIYVQNLQAGNVDFDYLQYKQIERENRLLRELLIVIEEVVKPLKYTLPDVFNRIMNLLEKAHNKLNTRRMLLSNDEENR